jgi:hypothetical protein
MSDTTARPAFITVRGSQTYRVEGTNTLLGHLGVWLLNNSGSVHFVREDELSKADSPHYASNRGANQDDRGTVAVTARGETYIVGRGLYQYRMDVFAEMTTKTLAELRAIVAGVHDGDRELSKGVSQLRKPELTAICAEWETGTRENEEASTLREQYSGTPARFNPEVIDEVHAVALIENGRRTPHALYMRRSDSALKFLVLGTVGDSVELVALGDSAYTISRTYAELVEDGWTACEADGMTQVEAARGLGKLVENDRPAYRIQNGRGATYLVLGTGPTTNAPHLTSVWVQREGEQGAVQWSPDMMMSPYYDLVALCAHGYTANDSCPGCDTEHDDLAALMNDHGVAVSVQAFGHLIELGTIHQHADCTWSAMVPTGEVIAVSVPTSDSAVRALTLDHKRRVWLTAVNEAEVRAEARELDMVAAEFLDADGMVVMSAAEAFDVIDFAQPTPLDTAASRKDREIDEAVRLLVRHGIDTPARFLAHVERVLKVDREAFVSDLLTDHHAALSALGRTAPVVTDTHDGSAL